MNDKINKSFKIIDEIENINELKNLMKNLIVNNDDEFIENYIIDYYL